MKVLVVVGVVGGDTEDGPACAQYAIPYLFIAEFAGGAMYVDTGMAVEDFEQAGASDLLDMVMVEGPVKVGVVNRGDAASAARGCNCRARSFHPSVTGKGN